MNFNKKKLVVALATILSLNISVAEAVATGPAGPKGATGPAGPKGATGLQGPIGLNGAKGNTGAAGPVGTTGATGTTGAIGPKGETGTTGATGVKGDAGAAGDTGATGSIGATGETGPQGPIGATGATGVKGDTGAQGVVGATGAKGDTGETGETGVVGLAGATGAQGDAGAKGDTGASAPIHAIGDQYQGGIIFWVDADGQHGLIAAKADLGAGVSWSDANVASAYQNNHTGTTGDGIYAGIANTTKIVAQQNALSTQASIANSLPLKLVASAAQIADNYSIQEDGEQACTGAVAETCYGDWYLPSKVELNLLYNQKIVVGGFANNYYWSSTEFDSTYAWLELFLNGSQYDSNKSGSVFVRVRAVRAF